MFVSPRFRDIFSSSPIKTRRSEVSVDERRKATAGASSARATDAEAIWQDITAAHRRAGRVFTPPSVRAEDLATDEA